MAVRANVKLVQPRRIRKRYVLVDAEPVAGYEKRGGMDEAVTAAEPAAAPAPAPASPAAVPADEPPAKKAKKSKEKNAAKPQGNADDAKAVDAPTAASPATTPAEPAAKKVRSKNNKYKELNEAKKAAQAQTQQQKAGDAARGGDDSDEEMPDVAMPAPVVVAVAPTTTTTTATTTIATTTPTPAAKGSPQKASKKEPKAAAKKETVVAAAKDTAKDADATAAAAAKVLPAKKEKEAKKKKEVKQEAEKKKAAPVRENTVTQSQPPPPQQQQQPASGEAAGKKGPGGRVYPDPPPTPPAWKPANKADAGAGGMAGRDGALQKLEDRLKGGKFRWLNEQLYTTESGQAEGMFEEDPSLFDIYHEGFREQVDKWPSNPVDVIAAWVRGIRSKQKGGKSKRLVVADLGCGEGQLACVLRGVAEVHSFDLVSRAPHIRVADIAKNVPLPSASVDIVVFCLALMGTNWSAMIEEANRILAPGGTLKIAEVTSRMQDPEGFMKYLSGEGFRATLAKNNNSHFLIIDAVKVGAGGYSRYGYRDPKELLTPCWYKRR